MTRFLLVVSASAVLCVSAFLGAALAGSNATATNYTLHLGDIAAWPSSDFQCGLVSGGQPTVPIVCGRVGYKHGSFGVTITRHTIIVSNPYGKIVFQQKR